MWKDLKTILIYIGVVGLLLTASFFGGRFSANRKWIDDYNRVSLELKRERERTGKTISDLEEAVERDGALISELNSENQRLGEIADQLRADNQRLRDIQSATEGVYRGLENILLSDMESVDKIIAIARALQEKYSNTEIHND